MKQDNGLLFKSLGYPGGNPRCMEEDAAADLRVIVIEAIADEINGRYVRPNVSVVLRNGFDLPTILDFQAVFI